MIAFNSSLPIIRAGNRENTQQGTFVLLRKHVSLIQELALLAPILPLYRVPEQEGQNMLNLKLDDMHEARFHAGPDAWEPVAVDYANARCADLGATAEGFRIEQIGTMAAVEFGRIQARVNTIFEKGSITTTDAFEQYLSMVHNTLAGTLWSNQVWKRVYSNRFMPRIAVKLELQNFEALRQATEAYMNEGLSLSAAIDRARFPAFRRADITAQPIEKTPDIVEAPPEPVAARPDILAMSFRDAVEAGFFSPDADETTHYEYFLKQPLQPDNGETLGDVYKRVSANPAALSGAYKSVGPGMARRLAEKIIRTVDSRKEMPAPV